jgi:hypothetical protein
LPRCTPRMASGGDGDEVEERKQVCPIKKKRISHDARFHFRAEAGSFLFFRWLHLARLRHVSRERRRALRLGTCDVATMRSGLQMRDAAAGLQQIFFRAWWADGGKQAPVPRGETNMRYSFFLSPPGAPVPRGQVLERGCCLVA